MHKVIGYIRVSTDKQDISPAVQRAKLDAYCTVKDWTLSEVVEDLRPGLGHPQASGHATPARHDRGRCGRDSHRVQA
jgi:Resolvase, N terminal domain